MLPLTYIQVQVSISMNVIHEIVAGGIIDGSNGDIAVDQYHRYLVGTHNS